MRAENRIDYVEIPVTDLKKARDFFAAFFGWSFQEWGDDYMSFNDGRLDGGFRRAAETAPSTGVLVVFYSEDLKRDFNRVQELGATISEPIFAFPGGRRFHFVDPTGTEYAIWSAQPASAEGE
ncbi:MAG: VOC family protein [Gammaproteobacteria bacterium]|nr:VOC family protein [Gammaproteobacteria bacterium]MDH5241062.1 VOC family protein [Gammaproteobacteria bacterium]MDH5260163.1 VOC family protein [Gammaproteobacteria bacterium]